MAMLLRRAGSRITAVSTARAAWTARAVRAARLGSTGVASWEGWADRTSQSFFMVTRRRLSSTSGTSFSSVTTVDKEQDFHKIGDRTLERITDFLTPLEDDDETELEMSMGVLKLKLKAPESCSIEKFRGQYVTWVINKQTPNRQIWWSSPISGPRRYEWCPTMNSNGQDLMIASNWQYSRAINHPGITTTKSESAAQELNLLEQLHSEILAVTGIDLPGAS